MGLIKCKECGADISRKAAACPKCGAALPRRTSWFAKAAAVVLIPGCIGGIYYGQQQSDRAAMAGAAAEAAMSPDDRERKRVRDQQFKAAQLRARATVSAIKQSANNPGAVTLQSVLATDDGAICVEYRAPNAFSALMPGLAIAQAGSDKIAAGPSGDMAAAWNKHCANKPGRDLKSLM